LEETTEASGKPEYKDRRGGLMVFGVLEILIGSFCALVLAGLLIAVGMAPQLAESLNPRVMGFAAIMYGFIAAALIWLGIGSILCRRWARALGLVASWSGLLAGLCMVGTYALFARDILAELAANPASLTGVAFSIIFLMTFFIVVPGAMVLFYRSSQVEATCARRDPVSRWTDRCPLPVLTLAVWLAFGTLSLLATPIAYGNIMPWFGRLLTGTPSMLALLISAAIGFCLAWGTYRLKPAAWWLTLAFFTFFSVSAAVTFVKVDLAEVYRRMGYPERLIEQMNNLKLYSGGALAWCLAVVYVLFLVYLIWIRKFFRRTDSV